MEGFEEVDSRMTLLVRLVSVGKLNLSQPADGELTACMEPSLIGAKEDEALPGGGGRQLWVE